MGRPKGGKNNYHSKETKIKIVKEMIKENLSQWQASKKYNINQSVLGRWRKDYLEKGEDGLENKDMIGHIMWMHLMIQ